VSIRSGAEAIKVACAQTRNTPGMCQANVRSWFNAPAAGDVDHDGDADAIDGWLSEPKWARHPGDRNPPLGRPLSFGRKKGHRALTVPGGVRSTDMSGNRYKAGVTSTVTGTMPAAIAQIERSMGVEYLGWSETIDGHPIPADPKPKGTTVDEQAALNFESGKRPALVKRPRVKTRMKQIITRLRKGSEK